MKISAIVVCLEIFFVNHVIGVFLVKFSFPTTVINDRCSLPPKKTREQEGKQWLKLEFLVIYGFMPTTIITSQRIYKQQYIIKR